MDRRHSHTLSLLRPPSRLLSLSVSSVSLCRLRAFLCSSRLALSSWDSDEARRAFLALSFSLLFLRRSSLYASVSDAGLALSRAFFFCRLSAVVVFLSFILYRNNLLSDCSNFKCACVTYVTYGDIISNEIHYRLVTELASLAQSREISIEHPIVGLASLAQLVT